MSERESLPEELWVQNIPSCPVCGHLACYDYFDSLIRCDNLDDTCPISPAVCCEIHNARERWDALCALITERDYYKRIVESADIIIPGRAVPEIKRSLSEEELDEHGF